MQSPTWLYGALVAGVMVSANVGCGSSQPTAMDGRGGANTLVGGAGGSGGAATSRSAGCAKASGLVAGQWSTQNLNVGATARTYRLYLPPGYASNRAYALVLRWHGSGGDGESGGLGIESSSGSDAIVVGGDALVRGSGTAWDLSPTGGDLPYFDALLERVRSRFCVDNTRVYSYGFSSGGGFTNLLSCVRANELRASAAIAGVFPERATCSGAVAGWLLHDLNDGSVPIDDGVRQRDRMLAANGCGTQTEPTEPVPCVSYLGCRLGLPVVWCESTGIGHDIRGDFAPAAVWEFFSALP